MARVYLDNDGNFVYENFNLMSFYDDIGLEQYHGHLVLPGIYGAWYQDDYTRYKPVVTIGGSTFSGVPYNYLPWSEICTQLNDQHLSPGPVTFHFEGVPVNPNVDYGHGKVKVGAFICTVYEGIFGYNTYVAFPTRYDKVGPGGIVTSVQFNTNYNFATYTTESTYHSKHYGFRYGSYQTHEEAAAKARELQAMLNFPTWMSLDDTAPTVSSALRMYENTQEGRALDAWLRSDEGWDMNTNWNKPFSILKGINAYILSASLMDQFQDALWLTDGSASGAFSNRLYSDPMQCILGMNFIPFSVPNDQIGTSKNIQVGLEQLANSVQSQSFLSAPTLLNEYVEVRFGTKEIERVFNDYRDFTETQCEIYLPCIGWHSLSSEEVMGKYLNVSYRINFVTGDVLAVLAIGDNIIDTVPGNCMQSIPISGRDFTNLLAAQKAERANAYAVMGGVATMAAGAVTGNIAMGAAGLATAVGAGLNSQHAQNEVSKAQNQVQKSGSIGGSNGTLGYPIPYVVVRTHTDAMPAGWEEYIGASSHKIAQVGTLTGFVKTSNFRYAGSGATEEERAEINALMDGGVII